MIIRVSRTRVIGLDINLYQHTYNTGKGDDSYNPYQNNPKNRIPIPITNAEIPANKNADDSACFKRRGLVCITASRRFPWSARTISRIPITNRIAAEIYFHMLIAY